MELKTFIVTTHVVVGRKLIPIPPQQPIQTGLLRLEIPAHSEEEARIKARRFLMGKVAVVIDECRLKPEKEPAPADAAKSFEQILHDFKDIFKNWKS
jgi:hypothetical protein